MNTTTEFRFATAAEIEHAIGARLVNRELAEWCYANSVPCSTRPARAPLSAVWGCDVMLSDIDDRLRGWRDPSFEAGGLRPSFVPWSLRAEITAAAVEAESPVTLVEVGDDHVEIVHVGPDGATAWSEHHEDYDDAMNRLAEIADGGRAVA